MIYATIILAVGLPLGLTYALWWYVGREVRSIRRETNTALAMLARHDQILADELRSLRDRTGPRHPNLVAVRGPDGGH